MADLNFKTITSTPTGVGGSTGKQTEIAFNENFAKVKTALSDIFTILSEAVISENLTLLKVDTTVSPYVVYYTTDPVDTPDESITWYPLNRGNFSTLLGSPYDNVALKSALDSKVGTSVVQQIQSQVSGLTTTVSDLSSTVSTNTTNIGTNSASISELQNDLLNTVQTQDDQSLYLKYDSVNQVVYISEDGTHWIDISGMNVVWSSISGEITDNQDLVDYVTGLIQDLAEQIELNYAKSTALQNHTSDLNNPHNVTKAQIGLGNVDNTSDLNKPISIAVQAALDNITAGSVPTLNMSASEYQADPPGDNNIYFTSSHFATPEPEPEEPEEPNE